MSNASKKENAKKQIGRKDSRKLISSKKDNVLTIKHDMQVAADNIGTVAGNNWQDQVTAQCVMTGDTTADGGSM